MLLGSQPAGELPVLNNQGEGVLIGFVDTGIHYMDPLFRSADGSTRIIGIWDQTLRRLLKPHPSSRSFTAANILLPRSIWP